jgi:hypothetical protein
MAHTADLGIAARTVQQKYYSEWVVQSSLVKDGSGFLRLLQRLSQPTTFTGKYTYFIDPYGRANMGWTGTDRSLTHMGGVPQEGNEYTVTFDELFYRTDVPGKELRDVQQNGDADKYVKLLRKVNESMAQVRSTSLARILLGDGTGKIATATNSAPVTIADDATGTIGVDDVSGFVPGNRYDYYDSGGTIVATGLLVKARSVAYGAGDLTVLNETGGSKDLSAGGSFYLMEAKTKSVLHGLDYIISATGTYPRAVSGSAQTDGYDRATTHPELQSIIVNAGDNEFDVDALDDLFQKMASKGVQSAIMTDSEGAQIGFNVYAILRSDALASLQTQGRALGRAFTLGTVTEDWGLRRPEYNGWAFMVNELTPLKTIHAPNFEQDKFLVEIGNESVCNADDMLGFQRAYGQDNYEMVKVERLQLFAPRPAFSGKITNVTGRTLRY